MPWKHTTLFLPDIASFFMTLHDMIAKLICHVQQCCSFSCAIFSQAEGEEDPLTKKRSNHAQRKIDGRKQFGKLDQHLEEQFTTGRLYGMLAYG